MNPKIQQLEEELRQLSAAASPNPAPRLQRLNALAWELCDFDLARAYACTEEIERQLLVDPSPEEAVRCRATQARIFARKGEYQQALLAANQALAAAEAGPYWHLLPVILATLGMVAVYLGNYADAMAYHQREYRVAQQVGDRQREGYALNNLGLTHSHVGAQALAYQRSREALAIFETLGDQQGQALVLSNIAHIHYRSTRYAEALTTATRALALARAAAPRQFELFVLDILGQIHTALHDHEAAMAAFQQHLELANLLGAQPHMAIGRLNMGRIHTLMHNEAMAHTYLLQALELLKITDQKKELYECHQLLSASFERAGDLTQALLHYKAYHTVNVRVFNEDTDQKLKNLQVLHEVELHKAEAELHRLKTVELQAALERVKQLSGLLPICANCKKIRDDSGYWQQVEIYLREHAAVEFSHGMCPDCIEQYYPQFSRKAAN